MTDFLTQLDQQANLRAGAIGWPAEALLRLVLAVVAGGLIGLEREIRGRQAGFRTNLLVCLGSALVMIVSIQFAMHPWQADGFNIGVDPARLAYSVMTGIGFIGAGTIIKSNGSVHGLTTAAAMWCVAAIGLAAGFGLYVIAILTTILVVIALWVFDYFEHKLPKVRFRSVVVRRRWMPECVNDTVHRMRTAGMHVSEANFDRGDDLTTVDISLSVSYMSKERFHTMQRQIEEDGQCQIVAIHAG